MRDQRDAARPEPRIGIGARNLRRELGTERAPHRRDVDADLLEHPAAHAGHDAAATAVARPRLAREAAGRQVLVIGTGVAILERLERAADPIAQRLEPDARPLAQRATLVFGDSSAMAPPTIARA